MKSSVIANWIEMSQTYLSDGPPRQERYEGHIFLNHCVLKQGPSGRKYLDRKLDVKTFYAPTKRGLSRLIGRFARRDDVRMLTRGLETNDFKRLPRRTSKLTQSLLDGTDGLYQAKAQ